MIKLPLPEDNHLGRLLDVATLPPDAHRGLVFERFFSAFDKDWKLNDGRSNVNGKDIKYKDQWLNRFTGACGNQAHIERRCQQQLSLVTALNGTGNVFKLDWNFITGMGNAHVLENGFSWHPTLGTPYLSGASIKGLLLSYLKEWQADSVDATQLRDWFGHERLSVGADATGGFIFFDALPVAQPVLTTDIMTPHMGNWYAAEESSLGTGSSTPGDWHTPVPVSFLAVEQASFLVTIAARTPEAQSYLTNILAWLTEALDWVGMGSKTAVGYGHMVPLADTDPYSFIRLMRERGRVCLSPMEKVFSVAEELAENLNKAQGSKTEQKRILEAVVKMPAQVEAISVELRTPEVLEKLVQLIKSMDINEKHKKRTLKKLRMNNDHST